jgi:Flp pilus assembly protein TadD
MLCLMPLPHVPARPLAVLPALALLAACAMPAGPRAARPDPAAAQLTAAQQALDAAPDDPQALAALGQAQLAAGRFAAAADSFTAAREGGDTGARTLLGQALALAGSWRHEEAAALLLTSEAEALPAGDRGLALAMAGEPEVAVRLLVLAVEDAPDSAALRQNLAFAFAMAGRWGEARQLAAIDVPAAQLPARLEHWARIANAGPTPQRMAALLGTDAGEPPRPQRRALAFHRPRWAGARW